MVSLPLLSARVNDSDETGEKQKQQGEGGKSISMFCGTRTTSQTMHVHSSGRETGPLGKKVPAQQHKVF